jgi:hypothetical protein
MIQRTFFQRFGTHGVCVLPDDVLSDEPLTDPETGEDVPSLRDQVSLVNGIYYRTFCYVRVLRTCGDGLYWADVAATPDLANTYRVILTEEDLYFALPFDVRVQGKSPAQILKMMAAHARDVQPARRVEPMAAVTELVPAPGLPLEPLAVVEVSTDDLQEAMGVVTMDTLKDTNKRKVSRSIGSFRMQQAFLRVIIDVLITRLYWSQQAQESAQSSRIKTQCAAVAFLQRWQRQSRQRIVNTFPVWNDEQHTVVWQLTVGDPLVALAAA